MSDKCAVRSNKVIKCDGPFISSEGCCEKHAMLFDIWIAEFEGYRVYRTEFPRNWKRSKFHKWLNILTEEKVEMLLKM